MAVLNRIFGAALFLSAASLLAAQAPPAPPVSAGVLAIGKMAPGATREEIMKHFPEELNDTIGLYLQGKITQWYSRGDGRGVIFIMNCKDADEARALLDALPLGKAKLLDFDLIPISPLAPLGMAVNRPAAAAKDTR